MTKISMDIIKIAKIRSDVGLNLSIETNVDPYIYSANVIVELLGYSDKLNTAEDKSNFLGLRTIVKEIIQDIKGHKYTKESLIAIVTTNYLSRYSLDQLTTIIGNTGYCKFPTEEGGFMEFKSKSCNLPQLRENYGKEIYLKLETPEVQESLEAQETHEIPEAQVEPTNYPIWNKWAKLYEANKDKRYRWQWKISSDEYKDLKAFLQNIVPTISRRALITHYSDLIVLFCAEWYKREFDGKGQGEAPSFKAIGCKNTQKLAKDLLDRSKIILRGNNRYINSLYVQGGLPWRYIISNKDANLAKSIGKVFKAFTSNNIKEASQYAGAIINSSIRESYINKGSIHSYIKVLLEDESYVEYILGEFPEESDQNKIKNFILGLKSEITRYFSLLWRLDQRGTPENSGVLVSMLSFSSSARKGCIPNNLLKEKGIDTDKCSKFNLVVKSEGNNETQTKSWTFYKCINGCYSTSENYDARIIAKYKSESELPKKIHIYIEDIPGPFGIWTDNGFGETRSHEVETFSDLKVIKMYGDLTDSQLYSTPKEKPLYILKRDFITTEANSEITEIELTKFNFYYIDKPCSLCVKGRDIQFAPYGRLHILLDSESFETIVDTTQETDHIYANATFTGKPTRRALLVSHNDLDRMEISLGEQSYDEKLCQISFSDSNDNPIENIKDYYGFAQVSVKYGSKQADCDIYILDVSRSTEDNIININNTEHHIAYDYQPDNSKEFTIGDGLTGVIKINIYYPFDLTDTIITCPQRKVWRSSRLYSVNKQFYTRRIFSKDGCNECAMPANQVYCDTRLRITRDVYTDGQFNLEKPKEEQLECEFYVYNFITETLTKVDVITNDEGQHIRVPDDIRMNKNECIVFQSLKSQQAYTPYRFTSPVKPKFSKRWWEIIFEHNLLLSDWFMRDEQTVNEMVDGYLQYCGNNPEYKFLQNLAITLDFHWLLLAKKLYMHNTLYRDVLRKCLNDQGNAIIDDFISEYLDKINKVRYTTQGKESKVRKIAKILAGKLNFWELDSDEQEALIKYLSKENTFIKLKEYLKY